DESVDDDDRCDKQQQQVHDAPVARGPLGVRIFFRHAPMTVQQLQTKYKAMSDLILILTTMPDDDRAVTLAVTLVDERLAACVHIHGPMTSVYRWKDTVERDTERKLVIKTTRARLADLEARLRALHPYELPELVVLDAQASDAYGAWVNDVIRN